METQDQHHYGLATDLRHLQPIMNIGSTSIQPPSPQVSTAEIMMLTSQPTTTTTVTTTITNYHHLHHHQNYDDKMMFGCDNMMLSRDVLHQQHHIVSTLPPFSSTTSDGFLLGQDGDGAGGCIGGNASTGRWPRQDSLTLLEIRSSLHPKFKKSNQKQPLLEQISRIMCEEHGYQMNEKKCKEKFENLHKYYKQKTKESSSTTQGYSNNNGTNYRFFHQLEALYGDDDDENTNINNNYYDNNNNNSIMSLTNPNNNTNNSSEFHDTSLSSDHNNNNGNIEKKKKKGKKKRKKIREFIDTEMRKIVEKQEKWYEKVLKIFEEKENERLLREENWRKQEEMRLEKEHKFWAMKREWIESRDSFVMDALKKKLKGIRTDGETVMNNGGNDVDFVGGSDLFWNDGSDEIIRIQQQSMSCEEEVANNRNGCFGYEMKGVVL